MSRTSPSTYTDMPVLVTGAAGFIGRWVARALTAAGADLTLAVRPGRSAAEADARGVRGHRVPVDLEDLDAVATLVASVRPTVVFNLAGYGVDRGERDPARAEALNAQLPRRIADALRSVPAEWPGPRLVHAGSALEYGTAAGDLREDTEPKPTTDYGRTKLAGTRQVLASATPATIARLFTVYGPGEHEGRLLPTLLAAARSADTIPLTDGRQQRDFTWVGDVAEGLLRLGTAEPAGVVNLATGTLTTVRVFVEIAAGELGIAPARLAFGALPTRPEEMAHDPVSTARLAHVTGWRPATTIAAGVRAARAFPAPSTG